MIIKRVVPKFRAIIPTNLNAKSRLNWPMKKRNGAIIVPVKLDSI